MYKFSSKFLFVMAVLVGLACNLTEESTHAPVMAEKARTATPHPSPQRTPAQAEECKVIVRALNLRAGPGADTSVLEVIKINDLLTVQDTPLSGVWVSVKTSTGMTGFVNSIFTDCKEKK